MFAKMRLFQKRIAVQFVLGRCFFSKNSTPNPLSLAKKRGLLNVFGAFEILPPFLKVDDCIDAWMDDWS